MYISAIKKSISVILVLCLCSFMFVACDTNTKGMTLIKKGKFLFSIVSPDSGSVINTDAAALIYDHLADRNITAELITGTAAAVDPDKYEVLVGINSLHSRRCKFGN